MPYNYEYLTVEQRIALLKQLIQSQEERIFELELADQEDIGIIADLEVATSNIADLKAKLSELEE